MATTLHPEIDVESVVPDSSVDEIFRKLNNLVKPTEQLIKERKSLKNPQLILKMVSGDLPSEEEMQTIKEDLKQLQKLVKLTLDHQTALKEAQEAVADLDKIIGPGPSPLREILESVTPSQELPASKAKAPA
jgi:hypothetical protein